MYVSENKAAEAEKIFSDHGGYLRTSEALSLGIHPRILYQLRGDGRLIQVARGLFRLASLPPMEAPDLVVVAKKVPDAVVCLISALSYHGITNQVPHAVYLAIARSAHTPRLSFPPVRVFRFSGPSLTSGIEKVILDGVPVRIYCPSKTVADCFKFRGKLGLDVAIEALRLYLRTDEASVSDLVRYAKVCRVDRIMRPYLEAYL